MFKLKPLSFNVKKQLIISSAAVLPLFAAPLQAADDEPEVIQVTGIRGSLMKSLDVKRESDLVVDAITAEDIGKFPDQNVAESLQRISGVSISRQNGEGTGVTVRGFGPAFNAVRYNNRAMATTNTNRDFDFQVLAPELVSGVSVYKSSSADLAAGGIGATINIESAKPLRSPGMKLVASAKATNQSISGETSPTISGLFSNTWADDKLGFLVAVSYSDKESRVDRFDLQDVGYANRDIDTSDDGVGNDKVKGRHPNKPNFTAEVENRERLSIASTFQYQPNEDNTLTVDAMLIDFGNFQTRYGMQLSPEGGTVRTNHVQDANGTFTSFTAPNNRNDIEVRPFQDDTKTTMFGVNWDSKVSDELSFAVDLAYSKASNTHREDQYTPGTQYTYEFNSNTGNNIPDITTGNVDPETITYNGHWLGLRQSKRDDSVLELKLDANYDVSLGVFETIDFGFYRSEREKSQEYSSNKNGCVLSCGRGNDVVDLPDDMFKPFPFDNYMSQEPGNFPRAWASFDYKQMYDIAYGVDPDALTLVTKPGQTFDTTEDSNSFYVKANFGGDIGHQAWSANFGLRYVNLTRGTSGVSQDIKFNSDTIKNPGGSNLELNVPNTQIHAEKSFSTVLPSLNVKLDLTDNLVLRAAASKVMTAPGMYQSSVQVSGGGNFENFGISGSNPQLEPFQATQFDLGIEFYADNGDAYSFGIFQKDITTNIDTIATKFDSGYEVPGLGKLEVHDKRFQNTDGGKIKGFEIAALHTFDYLPAPFDGLGVQANYTFADSSSSGSPANNDQFRIDENALPTEDGVPGFAKHSYNLIAFYEKNDFGMRLAYNWRDRYIHEAYGNGNDARYGQEYGQFDLTASYDVSDNVSVFVEGTNLTDEGTIREQSFGRIYFVEYAGRRLGAGVRVNF